jgi:hypothetical protein
MNEKELKQLALDVVEGRVFGTWNMKSCEHDLPLVFMPLALMTEPLPEDTAHIYEHLDKAGPMSVNGMPTFVSCRILLKEDSDKLMPMVRELIKQRKEFLGEEDNEEQEAEMAGEKT